MRSQCFLQFLLAAASCHFSNAFVAPKRNQVSTAPQQRVHVVSVPPSRGQRKNQQHAQSRLAADSSQPVDVPAAAAAPINDKQELQVRNLLGICSHLQNPELYDAACWADQACVCSSVPTDEKNVHDEVTNKLVASRDIFRGEILSLYPIHAIGITTKKVVSLPRNEPDSSHVLGDDDYIVFDDRSGSYFQNPQAKSQTTMTTLNLRHYLPPFDKVNYRGSAFVTVPSEAGNGDGDEVIREEASMFIDVDPTRSPCLGWRGHLATSSEDGDNNNADDDVLVANSVVMALPGAAPLCALVAVRPIAQGQLIVRTRGGQLDAPPFDNGDDDESTQSSRSVTNASARLKDEVLQRYASEIADLRTYLNMACPQVVEDSSSDPGDNHDEELAACNFYQISDSYASSPSSVGNVLHRNPDIFSIDHFLSDTECDRLIQKAKPHLTPCLIKNDVTGVVQQDPSRTSTNANVPRHEIPSIVSKIVKLTRCDESQLETFQILHYAPGKGEKFDCHTDGFTGPITACGFERSGRLVTIFYYLNTVHQGGETRFTRLVGRGSMEDIAPRKGTAVIHFPTTIDLQEDPRTEHEGREVSSWDEEKWLLVTWVWKHGRSDPRYDESMLPALDGDII